MTAIIMKGNRISREDVKVNRRKVWCKNVGPYGSWLKYGDFFKASGPGYDGLAIVDCSYMDYEGRS